MKFINGLNNCDIILMSLYLCRSINSPYQQELDSLYQQELDSPYQQELEGFT